MENRHTGIVNFDIVIVGGTGKTDPEDTMSDYMLHLRSPMRSDDIAVIVGDRKGLERLRDAVDLAIVKGAGGALLYCSDGEGYALAVALEPDMSEVQTSYSGENSPLRSLRERVPMYAVRNFSAALHEAAIACSFQNATDISIGTRAQYGKTTNAEHRPMHSWNNKEYGGVK